MAIVKVGYLGPSPGTFGYVAAEQFFPRGKLEPIPYGDHAEICRGVGEEQVQYGVVAIENRIDGAISETVRAVEDVFGEFGLKVCGETVVPIEFFLLRNVDDGSHPRRVLSHPSALRQCSRFVAKLREEGVSVEVSNSTAEAAEEASRDPDTAAIGSAKAQEIYGLVRLSDESIADRQGNQTRFWLLGKNLVRPTGKDKTAFLVNLQQSAVGVLAKSLAFFADQGITLLWIYANPIPGRMWEYTFLIELEGHVQDEPMHRAYMNLRNSGLTLNPPLHLGSYAMVAQSAVD